MCGSATLRIFLTLAMTVVLLAVLLLIETDDTVDDPIGYASDDAERYKLASAGYQSSGDDTSETVTAPVFSYGSGYYDDAVWLTLTADDTDTVYYTLDSATPDETSVPYTGPILVQASAEEAATVVRAVAYGASGQCSEVVTKAYFFTGGAALSAGSLPTVSIVTDPRNLYDETIGIFTNYTMTGWEREAQFLYIDTDGLASEQNIGIRLRGLNSRSRAERSLTLIARGLYDADTFPLSLFDTQTNAWILRTRSIAQQEGFLSSLIADRSVAVQEYQMVNAFINGVYCGVYSLLNRIDKQFLADRYQVRADAITYVKFPVDSDEDDDLASYYEMASYIVYTDMSLPENYAKACELVDMQSLIDYYAIQIYINNVDFSYSKNTILWKTDVVTDDAYADGKWRYALYDLDAALYFSWPGGDISYDFNFFTEDFPYAPGLYKDTLLRSLMNSPTFRQQFYTSFIEIAETNFDPERVQALLDAQPYQTDNDTIAGFFQQRPQYILSYLDDFMENYETYFAAGEVVEQAAETESFAEMLANSEVLRIGLPAFCLLLAGMAAVCARRHGRVLHIGNGAR